MNAIEQGCESLSTSQHKNVNISPTKEDAHTAGVNSDHEQRLANSALVAGRKFAYRSGLVLSTQYYPPQSLPNLCRGLLAKHWIG